jgi:CPA2 family monovalent cation:H+ antiporter-2
MIKLAGPVHGFVVRRFPVFAARFGQDTSSEGRSAVERSQWKELLSSYFVRILLYGVVLLAIGVASHVWLDGFVQRVMPHYGERIQRIVAVAGTLLVMAPFLWGLAVSSGHTAECTREILQENPGNRWPLAGLVLLRAFLAIGIIMGVIATHFQLTLWGALLVLVLGILGLHFARKYLHTFSAIEKRFIDNLNEKENEVRRRTPVTSSIMDSMGGYDVHLESVSISADSALVGKPLKDIPIRSTTGVNVVKITRGSRYFVIPGGEVVLYPGDEVLVVGTSEQLKAWRRLVRESVPVSTSQDRDVSFDVVPVTLAHDSFLTGKKLRSIKMREYRCMVISVMHGGELITNPKPDYTFTAGDIVYLAGERDSLEWLRF